MIGGPGFAAQAALIGCLIPAVVIALVLLSIGGLSGYLVAGWL